MKELDMKESAVLSVLVLGRVRKVENFSPYRTAVQLLRTEGEDDNFSEEEFDALVVQMRKTIFKIGVDSIEGKVRGKNLSNREVIEILGGRSITMFHNPLRKQTGEIYKIVFNVDGKGGIRHPDGSIRNETLKDATEDMVRDRNLRNIAAGEITRNAWKVDPEEHPEVRGRQHHIKMYVENFLM